MINILITGSSGFVGKQLVKKLSKKKGICIYLLLRKNSKVNFKSPNISYIFYENILNKNFYSKIPKNINHIVHLAALAHDNKSTKFREYKDINYEFTRKLLNFSKKNKIRKFIFLSSIKVNGDFNFDNKPFQITDKPNPIGSYAYTKYLAEKEIVKSSKKSKLQTIILRSPLIIGPNVKGNLRTLLKILKIGIPLPLKNINNLRSFISLDNLNDLIVKILFSKKNITGTFLISDDQDISTSDLMYKINHSLPNKIKFFMVNESFFKFFLIPMGKKNLYNKVFSSLRVDITHTKQKLNWSPKKILNRSIKTMVTSFLKEKIK